MSGFSSSCQEEHPGKSGGLCCDRSGGSDGSLASGGSDASGGSIGPGSSGKFG